MEKNYSTPRNSIKISYNPYTQTIDYYLSNTRNENEQSTEYWVKINTPQSPFVKSEFTKCTLQNKAYDILNVMHDVYNPGNVGLDIFFEGTKEDFEDFKLIAEKYFFNYDIQVIRGEMVLTSAHDAKEQIENIFEDMLKIFNEYPDNEITESIRKFNETVSTTIPICVMGLYSAGKSAFINSLIGAEILPSASDPTTAKTYKISSKPQYGISFFYSEKGRDTYNELIDAKEINLSFDNDKYKINQSGELDIVNKLEAIQKYTSVEERMYHALTIINNYDMNHNKNLDKNEQLWRVSDLIEVTLPINDLSDSLPFDEYDFMIYDTPGSNSAGNTDHIEVLKKAMAGQTNGLPIYVTEPDNMDAADNLKLIDTIDKLGNSLDKSNLIIIVNKSDQKGVETLDKKKEDFDDLTVSKLQPSGTYFVSSIMGLGAKKIISGNTRTEEIEDVFGNLQPIEMPNFIDSTSCEIFQKNMGTFKSKKNPKKLYRYNIIPRFQYDKYAEANFDDVDTIYRNSGLHAIESAIEEFALKYALYNKCRNAGSYLGDALDLLKENLSEMTVETENLIEQLQSEMNDEEKQLLSRLSGICKTEKNVYIYELFKENHNFVSKILDSFDQKIDTELDTIMNASKGKEKQREFVLYNAGSFLIDNLKEDGVNLIDNTVEFWNNRLEDFKSLLSAIIYDAFFLNDDQKSILNDEINKMKIEGSHTFKIDIKRKDISGKIFWHVFIKSKAHKVVREAYKAQISAILEKITSLSIKNFDDMVLKATANFNRLLAEHNPVLVSLSHRLMECAEQIEHYEDQKQQIILNRDKINDLTEFYFITEGELE